MLRQQKAYVEGVTVAQEKPEKPFGRSLSDFGRLKLGEQKLLDACRFGNEAILGYDGVPTLAKNNRVVRAEFLRFLLLGGDEKAPIHERGVALRGAFLLGDLDLSGGYIKFKVSLKSCRIGNQFIATNTQFDGDIDLEGSYLGKGLQANFLYCTKSVFLGNGFRSAAEVQFRGARIGGDFNCRGGQLNADKGVSLRAQGMDIFGNAIFDDGFVATGEVQLMDAQIRCNLDFSSGQLKNDFGAALCADRINVQGSIFFRNGFKASGVVRLLGAQIGSNLDCGRGNFDGMADYAIDADRINVNGSVFLKSSFKAFGTVNFNGAKIGCNFDCTGAHFKVQSGFALCVGRSIINGSVFLNHGFSASGTVHMLGTCIGGNLSCIKGDFKAHKGFSLNIETIVVKGAWQMREGLTPVLVNALHAEVAVLDDDVNSWAKGSVLDGFLYKSIAGSNQDLGEKRLAWLRNQYPDHLSNQKFRPRSWRHLQRILREMGYVEDAKKVGVALEEKLYEIGRRGQFLWPKRVREIREFLEGGMTFLTHRVFGLFVGYGYRPFRLVTWMLSVWVICGVLYCIFALPQFNAIAPSDPLVFQNPIYGECQPIQNKKFEKSEKAGVKYAWTSCSKLPGEYSTFSPLFYSLDLLLPVVDLGQENAWGAYIPSSTDDMVEKPIWNLRWGYAVRLLAWFETLFGWMSSLLLVAIISGFSRRNDEE
ncbi:hypothetical protein [Comamonas testosteroni]|nr:hypothetical protein [Comamonas testosteroni]